ncbi:MAG: Crp/Fnr family transcriptional regulator [Rhodocyclales bacterium]|nr:Crp/Fnr family transcriptional regulator [Rhodocyclales bacterium]
MRTPRNDNLAELMGNLPMFAGVDAPVIDTIAALSSRKQASGGERVYAQGEVARAFYFVLSGHVRRTILSSEGGEKVIDVVGPRHQVGLSELVGASHYISTAEAVGDSMLLGIGREGLERAMSLSRDVSLRVLAAVAEQHLALEQEVASTYFHSSCRRLVNYLLSLAGTHLDAPAEEVVVLPISKSLLAERMGVTPETLSRAFRDLTDAGLISMYGRTITLSTKLIGRAHSGVGTSGPNIADDGRGRPGRRRSDFWIDRRALSDSLGSRGWVR